MLDVNKVQRAGMIMKRMGEFLIIFRFIHSNLASLHSLAVWPWTRTVMCETASQFISSRISGAQPYSRSDQGQPPSHGYVPDPLALPALWNHDQTCEGGKTGAVPIKMIYFYFPDTHKIKMKKEWKCKIMNHICSHVPNNMQVIRAGRKAT